jgi:hypothetical protein
MITKAVLISGSKIQRLFPVVCCFTFFILFSSHGIAQNLKPVFNGRLNLQPGKLSDEERTIFEKYIIPAAEKEWIDDVINEDCLEHNQSPAGIWSVLTNGIMNTCNQEF